MVVYKAAQSGGGGSGSFLANAYKVADAINQFNPVSAKLTGWNVG